MCSVSFCRVLPVSLDAVQMLSFSTNNASLFQRLARTKALLPWKVCRMERFSLEEVKALVADVLQIGSRLDKLGRDGLLLGSIPEFDSMSVVTLLTTLEENYGVEIADDEVGADNFETLGALQDFINAQLS